MMFQRSRANSKIAVKNLEIGATFLAENGAREGVVTTPSGLQYEVLTEGSGDRKPVASDKVTVHYHGTLINGTEFDSSVTRNKPASFKLTQVIKGWTEGVQTMVVGQKNRFYIPASLAYGKGSVGSIEAGSTLIFDVELLSIDS
ncbi:FKBP-type peptidyl-prolyl cis-trans isomerase [Ferrimonas lipolytica]|nr:FKBP-type peptidyl-prolyl cis-trans isomerase [Ferrimonas lipolytica]